MAKRFTDTSKWSSPLLRSLDAPYKLLWLYILDDCDHAGIWQVDEVVARIKVGCDIDFNQAINLFKHNIQVVDNGQKWFIPYFIEFQYGDLNPANKVHLSIINIHKKLKIKPLDSPLERAKDKDKDKDKEKEIEGSELFERFWNLYDKKQGKKDCMRKFEKLKQADIDKIFQTLPAYIASTPDSKYRKMPESYLNGEHWNDEIVVINSGSSSPGYVLPPDAKGIGDEW